MPERPLNSRTTKSKATVEDNTTSGDLKAKPMPAVKPPGKSFRKLFRRDELLHYGIAAVIYITLGVLFQGIILNWIVGPLFIVGWMWLVPPLVEKWRPRLIEKWRLRQP